MTDISINKQPVFINLALAVADVLEDSSTPASLRDALNEVAADLVDQLSGGNSALELRALASVHTSVWTEAGTPVVAIPRAKATT